MRYNGDILTIPACGISPCPFNTFSSIIEEQIPPNNSCNLLHHNNDNTFDKIAEYILESNHL